MSKFWRNKIILAQIEATYGVDPNPGVANGVLATEVSLTPMEGADEDRALELPYFGSQGTIAVGLHAKIAFRVELAPSGAEGTPPAWGPLLRACAVAETITPGTDVVYNPITNGQESVTIYIGVDGTQHRLTGARGTAQIMLEAQKIPYIAFEFTGLFNDPAETATTTPDLAAWTVPQVASTANTPIATIGATSLVTKSFELDLGNDVQGRFLVGSESILVTGRTDACTMNVEAVPLTTYDPFAAAKSAAKAAVAVQHGTVAGRRARIDLPAAQMQRPGTPEQDQGIVHWPLRMVPTTVAGNDQWTLTLT